ncbi:hypothetical protein EG68_06570 [Paragonimus skrjabini miyazakii]|uniref:FERM domain-containing protein n=1 Tax=Paragonimus skrjabini miyazakii TaxID=59628 RepID=A0A8S9YVE8_9TREM|nr:hypothetical protein EG68_06570 [Paragonimus skrjabini miyazakii]
MTPSSLIVRFPNTENSYVMKFDKDITISDLCCEIRAKIREANVGNPSAYGIFVTDPDPKHSFWLDNSRMLSYYHLRDNFEVEYRCKLRLLVIQTMDGTKKTLQVDDSKTIAELMDTICSKMGITNHEEYSLIRPMDEEERMRTLTLRKAKSTAKDQDKLEKMKQKLHTDDELNWLSHGKTLRQHDVDESEILLLRRKFFFSDQNVDARDPVQLNLLYIQLKEAILNGTHPISLEQAIQLAALQCQSEIGVLTAEKAKHNPVDLKEHLPKEYWKVKGVEKRIQEAHRNLGNFDERESKLRYVQLCRSLPTYGITFFLIKEKLKGRNKLVPRLFGVSKESVMRVDEKTKEILETWPLTRIRRWAAGPNLFTLDFGQYNPDGNYAMQTTEGEQIGQLISGYIDIILRRQRGKQATMTDGDEENTIVEENVAPSRANVISNVSGTLPRGHRAEEAHVAHSGTLRTANYRGGFSEGHLATRGQTVVQQNLGGAQVGYGRIINRNGFTSASGPNVGDQRQGFQMIDLGQPKRALLSRIDFGLRTIQEAAEELETPIYSDDEALHGEDATTRRWRSEALEQARTGVWSHLGAMTMATGQLVSCIQSPLAGQAPEEFDYTSMDASLASIGMNVHGLMQCVRLYDQIDAASEGGGLGATLKQAAQVLSDAFLALIRATVPAVDLSAVEESGDRASSLTRSSSSLAEPQRNGPDRTTLLEAAGQVGDASRQLLQLISQPGVHSMNARVEYGSLPDRGSFSDMGLYPQVVDWEARDKLLSATKSVANQMAKLVKTAKQGAMDVGQEAFDLSTKNPSEVFPDAIAILRAAQARLVQAATTAGRSASRLVTCAKVVVCTMEQPESQDQLIRTAKEVGAAANSAHQDPVVSTLLSVASQLPASVGDGLNVVGKASTLVSAASSLLADLRAEATAERSFTGLSSSEANRRADVLEAEIRQLLATAQECASGNVQSLEHQQRVIQAAQRLMAAVHSTTAPILRARLTQGLEFATRLTASNVGPLVTVGGEVVRVCQGSAYKLESNLEHLQKRVMPQVNSSCSYARMEPYDTQKQTDLLVASQNLMQCLEEMLRITDAVVPTIPDAGIQTAFSGAARNTQACLTDLRQCYHTSEMVLSSEPPKFDPDTPRQSLQQQDDPIWLSVVSKTNQAMDTLAAELHSNTTRLLPDETLDSICVALWTAVSAYNRAFASSKQSAFSEPVDRRSMPLSLPPLVTRIVGDETSESAAGSSTRDWNHIGAVLNELLERLIPVFHGIRGLSAFLTASANAQSLDSNLARVLLISHGLSAYRQSSISGQSTPIERRSTAGPLFGHHDEQPQATAQDMLQHLLSIGESCLTDTGQLVAWALQQGDMEPRDEETSQAVVLAEQLTTSVNAVLGYVPGEVIIKRLFALLEDASRMLSDRNTSDQTTVSRATNGLGQQPLGTSSDSPQPQGLDKNFAQDMYTKLAGCAQRLAKVCLDASYELSEHTPRASSVRFSGDLKCFGNDSEVVRMAHMADRITSRLVELIQAAGDGGVTAGGVNSDHLLVGLTRTGYPVAWAFRHAMRAIDAAGGQSAGVDSEQPFQEVPLLQAILQLREWAVELSLQTEAKASTLESSCSELDQVEWTRLQDAEQSGALLHMRNHCEAAIRRVNTLLRPVSHSQEQSVTDSDTARSVSPAVCAIRVPVCQHTYPECLGTMHQLNEDIRTYTDSIPSAAANGDADSFVAAVKSVAQTTCQLLQLTNQAAYLVGAAHPASKPGHVSRLIGPDQLIALHDHIAAVRKGASELTREECLSPTPDGLPSLEVMNIATHMAQRATRLCQSTRPLLSDCKNSAEKKMLAEVSICACVCQPWEDCRFVCVSCLETSVCIAHILLL